MKDKHIKRKILNDRKFPTSEQINKHQNFNRLHNDFSLIKKLLLKKTLLWAGLISGVAMATVVIVLAVLKKENDKQKPVAESLPVASTPASVLPPLAGKNIPCMISRISSKDGGEIIYPNGSKVSIPADAFINATGKTISDSVDVSYREFHDPLDIFLSGISMTYDSAGTAYTLESAGMIEILAADNGAPLNLNKEKAIKISMHSTTDEARFNLYALDTVNKNWVYKGKDKIEKPVEPKTVAVSPVKNIQQPVEPAEPLMKPVLSDPQKYSFKITYDPNTFPELKAYENVLFQVTDDHFKPAYFKINWDKISLYNGEEQGAYLVKLKKKDTTINVTAVPVFDPANYSKALTKFQEQHNQVSKDRDQKELEKKEKLTAVNKELSGYNRNSVMTAANNMNIATNQVYRTFVIFNMGIHNCDFPLPQNPLVQYASSLIAAGKNSLKFTYSTIFIVEKGKNTVFRFSKGEPIRCNFQAANLIWTVTNKNDIAFFKQADFANLTKTKKGPLTPVVAKNQDAALKEIRKFCDRF